MTEGGETQQGAPLQEVLGQQKLVSRIHDSGARLVLATTGGGSEAISALLTVPGASRAVLEARVPYGAEALTAFLGAQPEQFCSSTTARAMAMAAYLRAQTYDPATQRAVGVGCTASLVSDRPKRGAHRLHVAWQSSSATAVASLDLEKGFRSRAEEEHLAGQVILNAVAEAAGLDERLPLELRAAEKIAAQRVDAPAEWCALAAGQRRSVLVGSRADDATSRPPRAIFPGAFHPLHTAHREMARMAAEILQSPVDFELSVVNADKPPLDFLEIKSRCRQFDDEEETLWLTRAPTFVEKSDLFPSVTFVVGADTIARIAEPRYYGDRAEGVDEAAATLAARGCGFLVFGRLVDGRFETLSDLQLPPKLAALCREVPSETFRHDLSSTEIRRRQQEE